MHAHLTVVAEALPRLLSLLDRNPASPTYGCFDRSYWLHRKTDFPVSTAQLSVHTLARLYLTPFPGNSLYGAPAALAWVTAGLEFTLGLQHGDGSFDEWYPNERGWAGPTGYVAHALCSTLELLDDRLPAALVERTERSLRLSARHLARRDEGDVLANHFAIAVLPLAEIGRRLRDGAIDRQANEWLERFKKLVSPEGWGLEYDGCDPGYTLGTLDFFADLHRLTGDPYLVRFAEKSFTFLSYLLCPDGSWPGALGSRHTGHFYPHALEYWSHLTASARPLLAKFRACATTRPSDQEDHYLHYRLADYLKAAAAPYGGPTGQLPYLDEHFREKNFPEAGFRIERRGDFLLWVAQKRGGAFRLYRRSDGQLLALNNGCLLTDGKQTYTSLWQGSRGQGPITGALQPVCQKRFRPATFLLFRLACRLMAFPFFSYTFKYWIRSRLITPRRKARSNWRRSLHLDEASLVVRDELEWNEKREWKKFFWGGEFSTRYVPQSGYYQPSEAAFAPVSLSRDDFARPRRATIDWRLDLITGEPRLELNPGGEQRCAP